MELPALHRGVQPPGKNRLRGVRSGPVNFSQLRDHRFTRAQAFVEAARPVLIEGADIGQTHEHTRHAEMCVRIDKSRIDNAIGELLVDAFFHHHFHIGSDILRSVFGVSSSSARCSRDDLRDEQRDEL